jgi:hypothetical protein
MDAGSRGQAVGVVVPIGERIAAVDAATAAVAGLAGVIHQLPGSELGDVVGRFGHLRALLEAGMVIATAEAQARGEIAASQSASAAGWVADQDWHLTAGSASMIAKAAAVLARPDLESVAGDVRSTDVSPQVAVTIAAEFDKMSGDLTDAARPVVLGLMGQVGRDQGATAVRQLHDLLVQRYGIPGVFQDGQDRLHRSVELSAGRLAPSGLYRYELTVDPEGRAVVEAAIGPLAAPLPAVGGTPDSRSAGRRRGEALIAVCRRSTAAALNVPAQPKATLHVTMDFHDLAGRVGAGAVTGTVAAGTLLGPDMVRRLACDALIIPTVLGANNEVLNVGRGSRLFTPRQVEALWERDRRCTFDGCDSPATWTEAHHLEHWADGGKSDIDNGALLCGPHHHIVHRDQLSGYLVDGHVVWDRKPGSYQHRKTRTG